MKGKFATITKLLGLLGLSAGAYMALQAAKKYRQKTDAAVGRWHVITVNKPLEDVTVIGGLPEPLARLGDMVEVNMQPAPANQGTELSARLIKDNMGKMNPREALRQLRTALRHSRMVLETGEISQADRNPSTQKTIFNLPVRYVTRHGDGEGRL